MLASVNPSTAGFSVFSTPVSIPSSTSSHAGAPTTRKRGRGTQEAKISQKRRKVIGRPKNGWTASRRRKLVRLYLMTNLEVNEIAKVLRTENFKPCKRDIQTQLATLLQARPSQIRSKGHTKQRLCQLRKCREAQLAQRATKYPLDNWTTWKIREDDGKSDSAAQMEEVLFQTIPPTSTIPGFDYPRLDSKWDALLLPEEGLVFEKPDSQQHEFIETIDNPMVLQLPEEIGLALSPVIPSIYHEDQVIECWDKTSSYLPSGVISDRPFSDFGLPFSPPTSSSFTPNISLSISQASELHKSNDVLARTASQFSSAEVTSPFTSEQASLEPDIDPLVEATYCSVEKELSADNHLPIKLGAPRSTTSSVASLKKRLSHAADNYSHSTLEDIVSLMEHFTITSSSSSTAASRWSIWSEAASSVHLPTARKNGASSLRVEYPIVLPGEFPAYCWEQINNNKLRPCNKGQRYRKVTRCRHMGRKPRQLTNDHSAHYKAYIGPGGEKVDVFGNSTLHIAGAFAASFDLLLHLVRSGVSVHILNSAGQTFLHLIHPDYVNFRLNDGDFEIDICTLLRELKERSFNFLQQDQQGRTTLHWLTRSEIPHSVLRNVCKTILDLNIPFPTTRDNIGCSVIDKMEHLGVLEPPEQLPPRQDYPFVGGSVVGEEYIRNYKSNNLIQTHEDLQRYAYQADLLSTINKSWKNSRFEDSSGRNGLHCLAEVTFDSPITLPGSPTQLISVPSQDADSTHDAKMEQILEGLLEAGVDPNNYDKEGLTPLMAFIIHMSPGKDYNSATRIFHRLYEAGANISRRNRQGETTLHLAVKFGNRAATDFLLGLKANVHARASNGLGVVALGHDCARKEKNNESLYAQIMLCVSLAINAGAVSAPTIIWEWGLTSLLEAPMDKDQIKRPSFPWFERL